MDKKSVKLNPPSFFSGQITELLTPEMFANSNIHGCCDITVDDDNQLKPRTDGKSANQSDETIIFNDYFFSNYNNNNNNSDNNNNNNNDSKNDMFEKFKIMEKQKDCEIKRLRNDLDEVLLKSESKIREMAEEREELLLLLENERSMRNELKRFLRDKEEDLRVADDLMRKLEEDLKSTKNILEPTKLENENMKLKLKSMEDHMVRLERDNELVRVKMLAMTDIMNMQDKQIQINTFPNDNVYKKKTLLEKWRESVFESMVRLKSEELTHKQEVKQLNLKVKEIESLNEKLLSDRVSRDKIIQTQSIEISHLNKQLKAGVGSNVHHKCRFCQVYKNHIHHMYKNLDSTLTSSLIGWSSTLTQKFNQLDRRLQTANRDVLNFKKKLNLQMNKNLLTDVERLTSIILNPELNFV